MRDIVNYFGGEKLYTKEGIDNQLDTVSVKHSADLIIDKYESPEGEWPRTSKFTVIKESHDINWHRNFMINCITHDPYLTVTGPDENNDYNIDLSGSWFPKLHEALELSFGGNSLDLFVGYAGSISVDEFFEEKLCFIPNYASVQTENHSTIEGRLHVKVTVNEANQTVYIKPMISTDAKYGRPKVLDASFFIRGIDYTTNDIGLHKNDEE